MSYCLPTWRSRPAQLPCRNPDLDPQLVWHGKDEQDGEDLVVDAPPIYIQEKIVPQVIIENLRNGRRGAGQLTLFDDFDGIAGSRLVEYYQHEANWSNRMILGDSLQVMASLAEKENLRGKVQMIYIDPPYGIKFGSNWQVSTDSRDVKDGKAEDVTREVEQIKAFRDTWELGIHSYLPYLRDRLTIARDLLTDSGSVFVQIGDENAHLVRSVLDEVFGSSNFLAEINYFTTSGRASDYLDLVSDRLLWYGRGVEQVKYRPLWKPRTAKTLSEQYTMLELPDCLIRRASAAEISDPDSLPPGTIRFMPGDMSSSGTTTEGSSPYEFEGKNYELPPNTHWKTHTGGLDRLAAAGRIVPVGRRLRYKRCSTTSLGHHILTSGMIPSLAASPQRN